MNEHAPVVCVMSGDFVQRGEPAIFPKHDRAEVAVRSGADLVVELPVPWCLSSAEFFAFGSVSILESLGVTHLSFGSESGDIEALKSVAEIETEKEFCEKLKKYLKDNPEKPYAAAVSDITGSDLLNGPNNLLGVEYIKAIRKLDADIEPITVKRHTKHDGTDSAKDIRERIYAGKHPGNPVDRDRLETAIISRLRMFEREYYNILPNSSDGLGNRLFDAIRGNSTLDDIYSAAKTKRYSHSAIRRLTMCAAIGIENGICTGVPPYIRVLAFNDKGREYLSMVKDKSSIPVITQPKEIFALSEHAQRVFAMGAYAKDLYELGFSDSYHKACGNDYRLGPVIV